MQKLKLTIVLAMVLFIAGCKKSSNEMVEISQDIVPISNQSYANQVKYAENNLKKIGSQIAKLTNDESFVNFVRTEVRKKFDTEYEVLICDLKKNPKWTSKLNVVDINDGLNAFKNVGGQSDGGTYYPQIYIPKLQYEEDENINNLASADSIYYIFYGGNEEIDSASNINDSYIGYIKDNTGNLQYYGMINEEFANTHEVWVFSLNESVDGMGRLPVPCFDNDGVQIPCTGGGGGCNSGCGGGSGGSTDPDIDPIESIRPTNPYVGVASHSLVNCKIQNMIVKQHKENWISGASEVAIRAVLNCHNNRENGLANPAPNVQYKSDQASHRLGQLICKVKRKKIRNQTSFNANFSLQTNWPSGFYLSDPIYFDYVIFERDLWPSPTQIPYKWMDGRTDLFQSNSLFSGNYELPYRSANEWGSNSNVYGSPYAKGFLSSTNILLSSPYQFYQSGLFNNAGINFNTISY